MQCRKDIKLKIKEVQIDIFMIEKQQDEAFKLHEKIKTDQLKKTVITLPKVEERFVDEVVSDSPEVLFTNYHIGDETNSADISQVISVLMILQPMKLNKSTDCSTAIRVMNSTKSFKYD